jgi:membrane protease subunit HflK
VVDEGHRAVVTRFGAFNRITLPGLHMHLPPPIESKKDILFSRQQVLQIGYKINEQGQTEDIPDESSMITGDRNIVDIEFRVIYTLRANSPSAAYDYAFRLRDPQQAIKAVSESAMREVIGRRHLETILTTDRAAIEQSVEQLAQHVLDSYHSGVDVAEVNLLAARPPAQVVEAFNEVVRAGQDAQAEINRATQYQNEQVPRAEGEATQIVQAAEGYRQQVVHEAAGEANRFEQIDGEYRRAPAVTRQRIYLETMEALYARANTIILDQRSGGVTYLPLDQLRRGTQAQGAQSAPQPTQAGRN